MPTVDDMIDASVDGRAARRASDPRSACPHPIGTAEHRYWLLGWDMEDRRQACQAVPAVAPLMSQILSAHGMVPAPSRSSIAAE